MAMERRKIKRKRPNFETAHSFHRGGDFRVGPEGLLTDEEHEKEIERTRDELHTVAVKEFPRTQNLEYAILKAHLIIEHAITQYIRCFARTLVDLKDIRFTFAHKLEIAYLMGFGANDPVLIPTVERLNKVRNQVAHSFNLDRDALDELLRINVEDYDNFSPKSDRERISILRSICYGICGRTSGEITAAYFMSTYPR